MSTTPRYLLLRDDNYLLLEGSSYRRLIIGFDTVQVACITLAETGPTVTLSGVGPTVALAETGPTVALAAAGPTVFLSAAGPTVTLTDEVCQ